MNEREKHSKLLELSSVGELTAGTYPTLKEFKEALETGRVYGDYDKRVVIVSKNPRSQYIQYIFVREQAYAKGDGKDEHHR